MLQTDRAEFDRQMSLLCAGYNVHASADRLEAYWRGLAKMELPTFVRVVEHCLGEQGPEKLPTARTVWPLARSLRRRSGPPEAPPSLWRGDEWASAGNRHLMAHLMRRMLKHQGFNAPETAILVESKNAWVEDCRIDQPIASKQRSAWEDQMRVADGRIAALRLEARARVENTA